LRRKVQWSNPNLPQGIEVESSPSTWYRADVRV
jgi:hypothetical protein